VAKPENKTHNSQTTLNHDISQTAKQTIQLTLTNPTQHQCTFWGHKLPEKSEGTLRIGLRNLNSLPIKKNHSKNQAFIQDIIDGQLDIMCATEVNVAWHNIPYEDRVHERFRDNLEFAKYVATNNRDRSYTEKFQRGGTLIVSQGNVCGRTYAYGSDNSILGRWSWIKVRGRHGLSLVLVTVYRPVHSEGILSAYQQHRSVLLDSGIDTCPRQQLLEDLRQDIQKWLLEGHQIIVAGDFKFFQRATNERNYPGSARQ
jgi:hypothetical protein